MPPPEFAYEARPDVESAVSLAAVLEDHLHSRTLNLPLSRASASDLRAVLAGPGGAADVLVAAIGRDPATLATVLREANREEFDALPPVLAPPAALARLGTDRARDLMEALVADAEFDRADEHTAKALDLVWRRSQAIALLAGEITARGSERHAAQARVLSVLSEAGAVFLLSGLGSLRDTRSNGAPITECARNEILRVLQDRYTQRLMAAWNLPPEAIAILDDRADDRAGRQLALALRLSRSLVASIGLLPIGCDSASVEEQDEMWDLADMLELRYVDVAALQVRAEMLNDELVAVAGAAD